MDSAALPGGLCSAAAVMNVCAVLLSVVVILIILCVADENHCTITDFVFLCILLSTSTESTA